LWQQQQQYEQRPGWIVRLGKEVELTSSTERTKLTWLSSLVYRPLRNIVELVGKAEVLVGTAAAAPITCSLCCNVQLVSVRFQYFLLSSKFGSMHSQPARESRAGSSWASYPSNYGIQHQQSRAISSNHPNLL
jgi:hypothetical protein